MSNEINTGKIPANLVSGKSHKTQQLENSRTGAAKTATSGSSSATADKLSMTDDAARLQQLEGLLKNAPQVNSTLVAEVSQLLALVDHVLHSVELHFTHQGTNVSTALRCDIDF